MSKPGQYGLPGPSSAQVTGVHDERSYTITPQAQAGSSSSKPRRTRPVPSPLQESITARSASDASSPRSPGTPTGSAARTVHSQGRIPTTSTNANALLVDRVRGPNPGKKAPTSPTLEEFRSVVTRDALREAAAAQPPNSQLRNASAPLVGAVTPGSQVSPPASPTMNSSAFQPSHRAELASVDGRPIMGRNTSIDSTVSSNSAGHGHSQKPSTGSSYRVSQENAGPQDVATIIAAAGSPEAAVQKLLNEKNQAASHNAQLWRLVEKQRAMILGLNKDLEKTLKEKERYRKKLKDHLVQSQSAPTLTTQQVAEVDGRESSQSPVTASDGGRDVATAAMTAAELRGTSLDSRKVSDTSELASVGRGRSDTPQSATKPPSSSSSQSSSLRNSPNVAQTPTFASVQQATANFPSSPKSISSPKSKEGAIRKAPPAPLQLSPIPIANTMAASKIVDPSDSDYEEDPDSARAEQMLRGRRKTREEDDREREAVAMHELEQRSQSKKKSKSKSKATAAQPEPAEMPSSTTLATESAPDARPKQQQVFQATADPISILRQRAVSDGAGLVKSNTAPSLMSPGLPMTPGLPMSPRPGHKPLNSPMPRMPNTPMMPMSPKAGLANVAGLPLSPRAPRQPLPMVPQTPLTFASPHLARAEMYHQQAQAQQGSISEMLKPSPNPSPEHEQPPTLSGPIPKTPGEVYRGLVVEQYPDLLLPPNALPSIYIRTSSSRLKPSRQSYIAPKQADESPVLTLAVYERSDNRQLWRVEKTVASIVLLDAQIKSVCAFRDRLPDKTLFVGHAPAKIDARRVATDAYFEGMLDSLENDTAAKILCKFLSIDAYGAEAMDYFPASSDARPDTPIAKHRSQRAGYLTKRGKNFGGWKARYFVLDGPNLKYFEAPGGAHLGSIKLQNAQIGKQSASPTNATQEDEDNQFRHAFLILEPKKKDSNSLVRHVLCAESDEERDDWVDALLQYVDFKDEEEEVSSTKGTQFIRPDLSGARSPRLQKSMNDLQLPLKPIDRTHLAPKDLRVVNYHETIAGEAPIIGPSRKMGSSSPPREDGLSPASEPTPTSMHPNISAPTNLHVISNAGDWGMKPPPTPQTANKDRKKSMFDYIRGRSSSDTAPGLASPGLPPLDRTQAGGGRAVFGAPLSEAVEFARPIGVATELPAVVYRCIEYLTAQGAIAEEGIFRMSGSNTVVKALKDRFNSEGDVNLVAEDQYYDIHAVASLLKLYFRELPVSILTRELHLDFMQCMDYHSQEKVVALNMLVNKLPKPNRALLHALAMFLMSIVQNAEVNKMNVRNVGIVFSPTLNVPGPLISSFVEEQEIIFGPPIDDSDSPVSATEMVPQSFATDLRSPRKQMFSDLPTPAYNQTTFQPHGALHTGDVGMIPMQPNYPTYQMAPQGDGGFGSLNDALRAPTVYTTAANGTPTPRDVKTKRRESAMMMLSPLTPGGPQKKASMSRLRVGDGSSF
ncbi:hypothetical protein BAUCODRAFT_80202 [Baudoinia panamericana UAMH 10762]|uniref:RhoGAP-domain-containing protein n=1 Tax=Baudoinia panamericana (strain UAMH 10762) TaxID=717646 RepID=M2LBA4_BAUPA|nr:uncharacterized protein BAUCODRAFT_80202 [Baudoinia panamericana UAMH 10762]EMC91102.1 hypothetical protein BAUCODRAFT_80202 [Baudoinia panamericana UAMH 10762]